MTARQSGGRPARLDPRTARLRQRKQTERYRYIDRETLRYLEQHHPKILQKARHHAAATVAAQRGPLPGDE